MNVKIFLNEYYTPEPQWCVWRYHDDGYILMCSKKEWTCKEDAEQFALEEMLE